MPLEQGRVVYSNLCQQKHTKCDSVRPTCGACARLNRVCEWSSVLHFSHDANASFHTAADGSGMGFERGQEWVDIPRNLQFRDETRDIQMIYSDNFVLDDLRLDYDKESKLSPAQSDNASGVSRMNPTSDPLSPPASRRTGLRDARVLPLRHDRSLSLGLQDEQEARLIRYFVDTLSPWFDLCDVNRHFATVVPRYAVSRPTLLNAICAVSARHLSRIGDLDSLIADQFYESCLLTLIPALHNPDVLKDQSLFAATVILRLFEELDDALADPDHLSHLLGIQVFLDAQKYTETDSSLGQAAFQVAMRQEIGMSFMYQRPVLASLMQHHTSLSWSPATEWVWGYRSSIYFAFVLEFCYGNEGRSPEKWQELADYHQKWMEFRPDVFEPVYYKHLEDDRFPMIYYLEDVHVITANNYTMARMLLTAHDPCFSSTEGDEREENHINQDIKRHVRELCGTALCNIEVPTAILAACSAITTFGDRYSEHHEQVSLFDILIRTEKLHGWATKAARQKLTEIWGWE